MLADPTADSRFAEMVLLIKVKSAMMETRLTEMDAAATARSLAETEESTKEKNVTMEPTMEPYLGAAEAIVNSHSVVMESLILVKNATMLKPPSRVTAVAQIAHCPSAVMVLLIGCGEKSAIWPTLTTNWCPTDALHDAHPMFADKA